MTWHITAINVLIIEWVLVSLATTFVILRLWMRWFRRSLFTASDVVICLTLACFLLTAVLDTVLVRRGFKDQSLTLDQTLTDPNSIYLRIPKHRLKHMLKILFASSFPYYGSLWGVKFSLVLLYYQIIPVALSKHRIALHIIAAIVTFTFISMNAINLFWCMPLKTNWEVDDPRTACVAYFAYPPYIVTVTQHAATEVLIFGLPFFFLHVLRKNKKQFYAALAIFGVGFLGVIVSMGRVTYVFTQGHGPIISIAQAWAALEQCIGIIVCCLPALKSVIGLRMGKGSRSKLLASNDKTNTIMSQESRRPIGSFDARLSSVPIEGRGRVIDPDLGIMRVDTFEQVNDRERRERNEKQFKLEPTISESRAHGSDTDMA